MLDFDEIKRAAEGRCGEIIAALTPLPADVLTKRAADHPCPVCGGKSVVWPDTRDGGPQHHGRIACRKCTNNKPTGDIVDTVKVFGGHGSQGEAAKLVADHLGLSSVPRSKPESEDIITAVCRDKRMPIDAFKQFEPELAKRNRTPVVRVPVWNERGEKHSHFDFQQGQKGKYARGQGMSGLFGPGRMPNPGDVVLMPEGCKDAAKLVGMGYFAIGMPGSCLAEKYAPIFRGVHVILIPDLDTAGQLGAQKTGGRLKGIAASVRVARLPGEIVEKGGDDVRDVCARDGGEQLVRDAIENAEEWQPREGEIDPDDGRPEVLMGLNFGYVVDQVTDCLGILGRQSPWIPAAKRERLKLYQRGGALVHVVTETTLAPSGPADALAIRSLPIAQLTLRITDACQLIVESENDGEIERSTVPPPRWLVEGVHSRGEYGHAIPPLAGIITAPTIRADGSVIQTAGYDSKTGLLYASSASFPPVPSKPTRSDAQQAAAELLDVMKDFPAVSDADRSAWLAMVLTMTGRSAILGACPLFAVTSNVRGSGKSLLVDTCNLIANGRPAARRTYAKDDEEMRKQITATAIEANPAVLLDNINGPIGGASLDAALTALTWSDRVLGSSRTTGELPLRTVWTATGNNLRFAADAARRVLPIRLESPLECPEDRDDFERPDLLGWIRQHRPRLAVAALTILRAYFVAGCPVQSGGVWGSYESWSAVVRSAIVWAGLADPLATRETARAEDESAAVLRTFIAGLLEMDSDGNGLTCRQIVDELERPICDSGADPYSRMRAAAAELCADRVTARRLGNQLKGFKGRVAGGVRLVSRTAHGGALCWLVVPTGDSAGSGDSGNLETNQQSHRIPLGKSREIIGAGDSGDSVSNPSRMGDAVCVSRTHMAHTHNARVEPGGNRVTRVTESPEGCRDGHDPADEQCSDGRTKTTCRRCGKFIGYRPVEVA